MSVNIEARMLCGVLLLFAFAHFANAGQWLYQGHACIGTRNNRFKELAYRGPSSFVGAAKLVHVSGYVSNAASRRGSYWGSNSGTSLATIITDHHNRIIYPSPRVTTVNGGGWYTLPRYTGVSPKLVFSDFGAPNYFRTGMKFRIWYGEDLKGYTEGDNHGTSCMQVYFYSI